MRNTVIKHFSGNGHNWNVLHLLNIRIYAFLIIFTLLLNDLCVFLIIIFTMRMYVLYFILYTVTLLYKYPYIIANAKPLLHTYVRILYIYSIHLHNKTCTFVLEKLKKM